VFEKCDRQVSEDCVVWTEEGHGWEINVDSPRCRAVVTLQIEHVMFFSSSSACIN
jgi:hypothetical protein